MIDLHCHIIPWVDDGAENGAEACAMALHALQNGVGTVVATPHCNLAGVRGTPCGNFRGPAFDRRLALFRALLRQRGIALRVLPGAELFAHPASLRRLLEQRRVVTLNHSHYLLVEFAFDARGSDISDALALIARRGLVPVVAHPERYFAVQADPALAAAWFRRGFLLQLNKGSLLGLLGQGAQRAGLSLLRAGFAHVIATDAHDTRCRTTGFRSLLPLLRELCPAEYISLLLQENPASILADRPIAPP